jgi:hypothetical protein
MMMTVVTVTMMTLSAGRHHGGGKQSKGENRKQGTLHGADSPVEQDFGTPDISLGVVRASFGFLQMSYFDINAVSAKVHQHRTALHPHRKHRDPRLFRRLRHAIVHRKCPAVPRANDRSPFHPSLP